MNRNEVPITGYDQETLDHLKAQGISGDLLARVVRIAQESAYWRMKADLWSGGRATERAERPANG